MTAYTSTSETCIFEGSRVKYIKNHLFYLSFCFFFLRSPSFYFQFSDPFEYTNKRSICLCLSLTGTVCFFINTASKIEDVRRKKNLVLFALRGGYPGNPSLREDRVRKLIDEDIGHRPGSPRYIEQAIESALVSSDSVFRLRVARETESCLHLLREQDPVLHTFASAYVRAMQLVPGAVETLMDTVETPRSREARIQQELDDDEARRRLRPLPWLDEEGDDVE
jgi:hypothetical protein